MKLRKGTKVTILSGKDRGKQGVIERVLVTKQTVVVGGVNMAKRHIKPNRQYPSGGIIEMAMPLHQSKVKQVEE